MRAGASQLLVEEAVCGFSSTPMELGDASGQAVLLHDLPERFP
jgi:hypothetical protein